MALHQHEFRFTSFKLTNTTWPLSTALDTASHSDIMVVCGRAGTTRLGSLAWEIIFAKIRFQSLSSSWASRQSRKCAPGPPLRCCSQPSCLRACLGRGKMDLDSSGLDMMVLAVYYIDSPNGKCLLWTEAMCNPFIVAAAAPTF